MAEISLELIGRRLDTIQTELREFKFGVDVDRRDAASWRNSLVSELGAKLATFELRIDNRLAQMDEKLGQIDENVAERLGQMDEKLGQMGEKLARIESLLQEIVSR